MRTHNIRFHGELTKISTIFLIENKMLVIWDYGVFLVPNVNSRVGIVISQISNIAPVINLFGWG